jgi:hypothetical protein
MARIARLGPDDPGGPIIRSPEDEIARLTKTRRCPGAVAYRPSKNHSCLDSGWGDRSGLAQDCAAGLKGLVELDPSGLRNATRGKSAGKACSPSAVPAGSSSRWSRTPRQSPSTGPGSSCGTARKPVSMPQGQVAAWGQAHMLALRVGHGKHQLDSVKFLKKIAVEGSKARMAKLKKRERTELARHPNAVRWAKVKAAAPGEQPSPEKALAGESGPPRGRAQPERSYGDVRTSRPS